ncbi:MAG: hypothetical protein C0168_09315 [Candidatus Aminicenantes bacterium]|nr:MAG: hypothetical protein C0168_09315 [Candidatus Aminicenantes bacterium]
MTKAVSFKQKSQYLLASWENIPPPRLSVVDLRIRNSALPEMYFTLARLFASSSNLDKTIENKEKVTVMTIKSVNL